MEITAVHVTLPEDAPQDSLRCWASVTFDDLLVIHNVRLDVGKEGVLVTMPREIRGGEVHRLVRARDEDLERRLSRAVVEAYNRQASPGQFIRSDTDS